jgi:hypothetical protein
MLRKAACAAFILYQLVWLGAVVPGHTRGRFTLPGAAGATASACGDSRGDACCHAPASSNGKNPGERQPSPGDRARCAVCHFAAGLSAPAAFSYDFAPAGVLSVVVLPPPPPVEVVYTPAYYGRGPPSV